MGYLSGNTNKIRGAGFKKQLIIGTDFSHSPIGNHKHSQVKKSQIQGEIFAKEYVKSFNTTKAAKIAGLPILKIHGQKQTTCQGNPKARFAHLIDKEMKKMGDIVESVGVTPEQVVDELIQIAFNSSGEFAGNAKVKVTTDHKLKALDMLAKYLGLYEKDNKQKVADTKVLQVAFVGADYAETQILRAKEIAEVKEVSAVDGNKELEKRNDEILKKLGVKE